MWLLPAPDANALLQLVRQALVCATRNRRAPSVDPLLQRHRSLREPAGLFVTLVSQGRTRACWGSLEPDCPTLVHQAIQEAQRVISRDRRFPPVRDAELDRITIELSVVLSRPRIVEASDIRPVRDGVLVRSRTRSAVVLPHEGRTVRALISLAKTKAGIPPDESVTLLAFRTQRIRET